MSRVLASAMTIVMALCFLAVGLALGGVNPELVFPGYAVLSVSAGIAVIRLIVEKDIAWINSPMHWPVFGFFAYALARYFTSPVEYDARFELLQVGACFLVYVIASIFINRPQDRNLILATLIVLAVAQSAYGIYQSVTKSDFVFWWMRPEIYHGRGSGFFIYPNHLAAFLEMVLGLVLARLVVVRREAKGVEQSFILKLLTGYAAVMIVSGIIMTFSRASWVAMLASVTILLFVGEKRIRLNWPRMVTVATVIGLMGLAFLSSDSVRRRLGAMFLPDSKGTIASLKDPTLGSRTLLWKGTLGLIKAYPVFGSGMASWRWTYQLHREPAPVFPSYPEYAHNDILNLASDYGLLGFLIVAGLFWGFGRHALAVARSDGPPDQRALASGALVSVGAILLHSWFDFTLHLPANSLALACILGMVSALDTARQPYPRRPLPRFARWSLGTILVVVAVIGMRFLTPMALGARHTDLGNRLKTELQYDWALYYYARAIEFDAKNPEPYARTGDLYRALAQWRIGPEKEAERKELAQQAIAAYDFSLELNPYQSFVWLDRGRAQQLAANDPETLRSYQRASEVDPANTHVHFLLGTYFRDHGDAVRAQEHFKKAESYHYAPPDWLKTNDVGEIPAR
jgi:O-antigen ligase